MPATSSLQQRARSAPALVNLDRARRNQGGLSCGGCGGPIMGRIVNAMGARWHPECFKCTTCNTLLEHVSSYEHDGKPYCHLDYHENFAPRCYHCKTAIIEERFISLDDPALGKRTYHEPHFFCAECGDPFLAPSSSDFETDEKWSGELALSGDGEFESDNVGFTVYRGHPYCESCHVRLRLPKCKRCKKSIRDGDRAVEALGGKWCWACFVCESCQKPFEDPAFFQRAEKPYCEPCFSLMLRNEV
ncbi:LIM domain-containing protein [Amanita rubescens]|nr:LIM domain-containing protein [Amanita rubescens]